MDFKPFVAAAAAFLFCSPAQAALIDFTDGIWETALVVFPGEISGIRETVDGVTFRILLSRGLSEAELNSSDGIFFGTGAGAQLFMTISSTFDDVRITGIRGVSTSQVPQLPFRIDYSIGDEPAEDLTFATAEFLFPIGPVEVPASGLTITDDERFDIDHSPYNGLNTSGFLTGIEFERVPQPPAVPVPAGFPLMLAGFAAFGWLRRHQ
ncbi:MAG: VPLPA-CTERM sorting domain-containing protein [Pseudomonadota bacterium]